MIFLPLIKLQIITMVIASSQKSMPLYPFWFFFRNIQIIFEYFVAIIERSQEDICIPICIYIWRIFPISSAINHLKFCVHFIFCSSYIYIWKKYDNASATIYNTRMHTCMNILINFTYILLLNHHFILFHFSFVIARMYIKYIKMDPR